MAKSPRGPDGAVIQKYGCTERETRIHRLAFTDKGDPNVAENKERQIQIRIDESKMETTYANTIRTSTTQDEVVLDFGMNLPVQGQDGQPTLSFNVGSRVVMNWSGAKRLAITLGQVVRQYEEKAGEIQLGRGPGGGASPRLAE